MRTKLLTAIATAFVLATATLAFAQSDAPYTEGPIWTITMVKTKPGMDDDYLRMIAKTFKVANEEAKKAGIISDYRILVGDMSTPEDFNILLMQQLPNMAALDGLREKMDPIDKKVQGSLDAQRQGAIKRMEVRDIMGNKLMREITLK